MLAEASATTSTASGRMGSTATSADSRPLPPLPALSVRIHPASPLSGSGDTATATPPAAPVATGKERGYTSAATFARVPGVQPPAGGRSLFSSNSSEAPPARPAGVPA